MLICPVRQCGRPLSRETSCWVCPQGHSFDIAKSGYVNLLQPQERRSKQPGDTAEAVAARRRIHERGITKSQLDAILAILEPKPSDVVLDAGCGEGFYLGSLAESTPFEGHGIDISIPAIDAAARKYPQCSWVVGNADRSLPYADHSFSTVLSITARLNPAEFHRVLQPKGRLLTALPASRDLIEIRGEGHSRVERVISECNQFTLIAASRITVLRELDAEAIADLRTAIYRPLHNQPIAPSTITFSLDLLLFQPNLLP